jgi:hypothetical protein
LEPGLNPFPPIEGIKDGDTPIIKTPKANEKPIKKTPKAPQEPEKETNKIIPIPIPIPFNTNDDKCCQELKKMVQDLADDLECVIQNVCFPEDDITPEYLIVRVDEDPWEEKIFNPSTSGAFEQVVISGYARWIKDGKPVGNEMPIRRREQIFRIPRWADGYNLYPCHGSSLSAEVKLINDPD